MCGIFGRFGVGTPVGLMSHLAHLAVVRGRDGFGVSAFRYGVHLGDRRRVGIPDADALATVSDWDVEPNIIIGNTRAVPTTEKHQDLTPVDQQPYRAGKWFIVHNGIVSNDAEILSCTRPPTPVDSYAIAYVLHRTNDPLSVWKCLGAKAVAATDGRSLFLFRDFMPLYLYFYPITGAYVFTSVPLSSDVCLRYTLIQRDLPPYCMAHGFLPDGTYQIQEVPGRSDTAAVICSGGLDSTVAAKIACDVHGPGNVTLLHFRYGCRASAMEVQAVQRIAHALGCHLRFLDSEVFRTLGGSTIMDPSGQIADGVSGAETPHEWVPARNTVMLAYAAAYCDRYNIGSIYTGFNLEESGGGFCDNNVPYYDAMDRAISLGTHSRTRVVSPLGNMMKHEVVRRGHDIGAPVHLTWSCYREGPRHCGRCGPCYMRSTAHAINGMKDPVFS